MIDPGDISCATMSDPQVVAALSAVEKQIAEIRAIIAAGELDCAMRNMSLDDTPLAAETRLSGMRILDTQRGILRLLLADQEILRSLL
jgi:hypothetical protein